MPFIPNLMDALGQQSPGQAATNPMANQVPITATTATAPGAGPGPSKSGAVPTGAASSQQAPQPQTNVSQYLTANAPQIQGQANTISGALTNQYGQVMNDIGTGAQNFTNEVNAGYTPYNPTLIGEAEANPSQFASNPTNVTEFGQQINDSYTGPQAFETTTPYTALNNEVQNAVTASGEIGNPAGNLSGVQTYLGASQPQETPGAQQLDASLLSQSPAAYQQVVQAAAPMSSLTDKLANDVTAEDMTATNAGQNATLGGPAAQTALQTIASNLTTTVNDETAAGQTAAATQNAQVLADMTSGNLTPADLAVLGWTPAQWSALQAQDTLENTAQNFTSANGQWGDTSLTQAPNLQQYLTQGNPMTAITTANSATAQDYANNAALAQLAGTANITPSNISTPLTQTNATQAGTAPTATNLNASNYNAALNNSTVIEQANRAAAQAAVADMEATGDAQHAEAVAQQAYDNAKDAGYIGSGVGTVVGGVVGSYFPVVGTMAGMAIGSVVGNLAGRQAYETYEDVKEDFTQPSLETTGLDIATGGLSLEIRSAVQAVESFFSGGSWVCTAMKKAGVLTQQEVDALHNHLYPAFWKRPFAFMRYWLIGRPVVWFAESVGIDWNQWKPVFYDNVLTEPIQAKAVDLYERAFWRLFFDSLHVKKTGAISWQ